MACVASIGSILDTTPLHQSGLAFYLLPFGFHLSKRRLMNPYADHLA